MNRLTEFLLNFVLVRNVGQIIRNRFQRLRTWLTNVKPFSWEAMLLLGLFSWFVYLLVQGFYPKKIVSIFAWIFLIIASDWALLGKQVRIPLIGFKVQHGPWITGAIAALALLFHEFIITSWRGVLISWPILSVIFAAYSQFIRPGFKLGLPGAAGRQELVLLFLIGSLFSSWFQLHFWLQDTLDNYPNLLAYSFERSLFVTRPNSNLARNRSYELLTATEATIRQNLTGKSWIETQGWLSNLKAIEADLSRQVIESVYGEQFPDEQRLWQITANAGINPTNRANLDLILQVQWQGASPAGYRLRQTCSLSEVSLLPPQTFEQLRQSGFQLTCQQATEEQAG